MKKLFVSFTSLLRLIGEGKVTSDELRQGLYFFGCSRAHAFNPGAAGEADERTWNGGRYAGAHPVLLDAVRLAESEGRAGWHNGQGTNPWHELDELLPRAGFQPLEVQHDVSCHYSYPGVVDAAAQRGLPLQVVY